MLCHLQKDKEKKPFALYGRSLCSNENCETFFYCSSYLPYYRKKRLNCYEKEPMHKSALECEKQTCCEERNERQQQNKKRANSEDYPSSPSPVFACRFFTVVFLFDRCNSTESLRLVLIERFSLDCRIGIGFGFGFGFTTSFGWLVYLLWFWFYTVK